MIVSIVILIWHAISCQKGLQLSSLHLLLEDKGIGPIVQLIATVAFIKEAIEVVEGEEELVVVEEPVLMIITTKWCMLLAFHTSQGSSQMMSIQRYQDGFEKKIYEVRQNKQSSVSGSRQISAIITDDLTSVVTRGVMAATQQDKSDLVQGNQSEHEENEGALTLEKNHTEMDFQLTHQIFRQVCEFCLL